MNATERTERKVRGGPRHSKTPKEREVDLERTHARLQEGVEALKTSAGWRTWLEFASKMPTYSLNNQLLIAMQRPTASTVAGYSAWQCLGRQVRKGETGIRILAPNSSRLVKDADQSAKPAEVLAAQDVREASNPIVTGFRVVSVFDVEQTEGDPLPQLQEPKLLEGQAPKGLWDGLARQVTQAGFDLGRVADASLIGWANGVTDYRERMVKVRADVTDAQAVKTLAHELGHVLLHDPKVDPSWAMPCRKVKEVEAESVAYLVTAHAGLDSSDYTFGYVASWGAGKNLENPSRTAARILAAAKTITTLLDSPGPATLGLNGEVTTSLVPPGCSELSWKKPSQPYGINMA